MQSRRGLSRREMIGLGALGGVSLLSPRSAWALPAPSSPAEAHVRPKNIIFMVADGQSLGVPSLAEPFSHLVRGRGTHWARLMCDARSAPGFFETHALNTLVTDSAAASTAWASGSRVFNGSLNVLPDGTKLTPIGWLARSTGRRIGLVTTTTITHATPAGFASVQRSRDAEADIAAQYLGYVDVLMGGGREFFAADRRSDGVDLVGRYVASGYRHWDSRSALAGVAGGAPQKILGLFGTGHLPFTLDWQNQPELEATVPTLAEMTQAALTSLADSARGFLLQVEGGRVDHAAHANDAAAMLWDQLAFDDAIGVALAFAESREDTLVIVTSDHANANPGLNGIGASYADSTACFEVLAGAKASHGVIRQRLRRLAGDDRQVTADNVIEVVRDATGIELAAGEAEAIRAVASGQAPADLNRQHANFVGTLGQTLGNHNGIGWTGVSHTADLVLLAATGPGASRFRGLLRNTDAFTQLTELMDIRYCNPTMTPRQAARFCVDATIPVPAHWA